MYQICLLTQQMTLYLKKSMFCKQEKIKYIQPEGNVLDLTASQATPTKIEVDLTASQATPTKIEVDLIASQPTPTTTEVDLTASQATSNKIDVDLKASLATPQSMTQSTMETVDSDVIDEVEKNMYDFDGLHRVLLCLDNKFHYRRDLNHIRTLKKACDLEGK